MNTSVRAKHDARGFSFVELLVTIIIAGIVFAAMVPLFVQAAGKNSADNVRNISLQIAQDKIEKIRQLGYDQIVADALHPTSEPNLYNDMWMGEQFGPSWDFRLANGATRTFTIAYKVDPVPLNAAPGQEKFKQVTVTVRWTAPPTPVKSVVLVTRVYKQNAGPDIITAEVGPPEIFKEDPLDVFTIVGSPVVIDVYISFDTIASMDASNPDPTKRGWVKFAVGPYSGTTIASAEVNEVYNGEAGHYQFVWDNSAVPDGIYRIEAIAFSKAAIQGSSVSMPYNVALTNPSALTGLVALPGDRLVSLSWDPSAILDRDHYEVWRGTAAGSEAWLADSAVPNYTDTAVNNGTKYFYVVRVVDKDDNSSSFSAEVSVVPAVLVDKTPPTTPTGFTAVKLPGAPTVNLAWTASTDPGSPTSGVLGYIIERSTNGGSTWSQIEGAYPNVMYPDSAAGWGATLLYRVAAIDKAGLLSGYAQAGPVTTDPQPKYSLTVANTLGVGIYVWVQMVAGGQWYSTGGAALGTTRPAGQWIKKSKSEIWSQLPSGIYQVLASTSTTGTPPLTSQSGSGDLSSGNNTITF